MISVEHLTKAFPGPTGPLRALDDVSLEVPAGTVCGVVGPSGAGKSTLARCIPLLERPDSGAVRVDGTDLVALRGGALRDARRRIGVVPQGDSLLRQRSVAGNVALPLEAAGADRAERRVRVGELLELVGLADKAAAYPDQLSGGQRQRVAVARALAARPRVLLADEPTSALDPTTTASVLDVLERARVELGVTVLVVTHDMFVVRRICATIAVLDHGRVVEHGSVLDLVTRPGSRAATALLPPLDDALLPDRGVVADVVLTGDAAASPLLSGTATRHGAELTLLGGGFTDLAGVPVARFRIGLDGGGADAALATLADAGAAVERVPTPVVVA
ncbi:methionine ABC transporter ATP-binding protein [Pseudonocardia kunmingensis]|uniref:D-methionine transport system ATP-binding protein n=1 Tax=Pseudonocardia kunmingensis TaxID=630975 RepID=A0A543DLC9_9PSEU|nr:methionine ABC transporter ATP-binding protein [Pseudonocardia kunmingensis]TQM10150.1 D-methionine transport system ATP-binding protein [Pseudonocardia kunmingensis]